MLVAASVFDDLDAVVALAPNDFVCEGIQRRIPLYTGKSSWIFHGKPWPFTRLRFPLWTFIKCSLQGRQVYMAAAYERAFRCGVNPDAWIPMERAKARILLLSVTEDSVWPSRPACERMMKRLKNAAYPYAYKHISFEHGSHLLSPMPEEKARRMGRFIRMERVHPQACKAAREEAFAMAMAWIMEA